MTLAVEIEAQSVSQKARFDRLSDDFDAGSANGKIFKDTWARREQLVGPYVSAAHSLRDAPHASIFGASLEWRRRGVRAGEAEEGPKRVEKWHYENSRPRRAVRTENAPKQWFVPERYLDMVDELLKALADISYRGCPASD